MVCRVHLGWALRANGPLSPSVKIDQVVGLDGLLGNSSMEAWSMKERKKGNLGGVQSIKMSGLAHW
jgi:hypothetical protein